MEYASNGNLGVLPQEERPYQGAIKPSLSLNNPWIRPYFSRGWHWKEHPYIPIKKTHLQLRDVSLAETFLQIEANKHPMPRKEEIHLYGALWARYNKNISSRVARRRPSWCWKSHLEWHKVKLWNYWVLRYPTKVPISIYQLVLSRMALKCQKWLTSFGPSLNGMGLYRLFVKLFCF